MAKDKKEPLDLRPRAHRRAREDQARPAARHQQDLPRRLLPPRGRRRRSAVQLLLRQRSRSTTRSSATSRRPRPTRSRWPRSPPSRRRRAPRRTTASCSTPRRRSSSATSSRSASRSARTAARTARAADLVGFKVRSNTGAPWVDRKSGGKLDTDKVVPIKPTPLMDAVMSGSPDQVRNEAYKQRDGQPARHRWPPHRLAEGAVRGHRQGREPPRRLRAVLGRALTPERRKAPLIERGFSFCGDDRVRRASACIAGARPGCPAVRAERWARGRALRSRVCRRRGRARVREADPAVRRSCRVERLREAPSACNAARARARTERGTQQRTRDSREPRSTHRTSGQRLAAT